MNDIYYEFYQNVLMAAKKIHFILENTLNFLFYFKIQCLLFMFSSCLKNVILLINVIIIFLYK